MNALLFIRKQVFRLATQTEFAAAVGVGQASVSRWENGSALSSDEMKKIREAAAFRGLPWEDRWFFDVPDMPLETAPRRVAGGVQTA